MEKPELFSNRKEFFSFSLILLFLLVIHLYFKYVAYQEFIAKPFYYTYAKVLHAYSKTTNNKSYQVLKLRSVEGLNFYTTTHQRESLKHTFLRVQIFPNMRIKFIEYLGIFYIKSKIKSQEKIAPTFKDTLLWYIAKQHNSTMLENFYNAIFFATPIEKTLRDKIAMLGISHLVALSGFHLGILWGLLYGILLLFYRPFQQKYFPYRYAFLDVGILVVILLGVYVWFVDLPASLVRAYTMLCLGWMILLGGMTFLSFRFLTTILLVLLVIFPSLLVSYAFWFSISGVFYIFLLLQESQRFSPWMVSLLVIPIGIFILMLPLVHMVFGLTTQYQLLSPLLSILFIFFYPLVMGLHLLGMGGVLDGVMLWLFSLPHYSAENLLSPWVVSGYVALSLGAIWYRRAFYLLFIVALLYSLNLYLL